MNHNHDGPAAGRTEMTGSRHDGGRPDPPISQDDPAPSPIEATPPIRGKASTLRRLIQVIPSHVLVASLAMFFSLSLPMFDPETGESTELRSTVSSVDVELRGGRASRDGIGPGVRIYDRDDYFAAVLRCDVRATKKTRVLIEASSMSTLRRPRERAPRLFIAVEPRHRSIDGYVIRYEGDVPKVLPLSDGLWKMTFMVSDPSEGRHERRVYTKTNAWLRIQV